jgi:hypothetical protein
MKKREKRHLSKQISNASSLGMFYLDAVINVDLAIKHAQQSMWKALKGLPEFNISMEETQNVLERYAKSNVMLVVLHIGIVVEPTMSMTLPVDRLATIIQVFMQEMSLIIAAYSGYVLKYVGDAESTCGCKDKNRKVAYVFIDAYHSLCLDKKDIISAEIEACDRLSKYTIDEKDKMAIQTEIAGLKMSLDLMH